MNFCSQKKVYYPGCAQVFIVNQFVNKVFEKVSKPISTLMTTYENYFVKTNSGSNAEFKRVCDNRFHFGFFKNKIK